MIRLILMVIVIVPSTIWYGLRIAWATSRLGSNAPCVCEESLRNWARRLLRTSGVQVDLLNAETLDPHRPQIVVANHSSWYDVLALMAFVPGRFVFVAKRELEKIPVFGRSGKKCGHLFIDRYDRARAFESLDALRRTLVETSPTIIMFPEGTRSPTGEVQAFKKGAFVLAIQTNVEIVPAAISGSRAVLRKGAWRIRPGRVTVRFGAPIPSEGYDLEHRDELTRKAREALIALLPADQNE